MIPKKTIVYLFFIINYIVILSFCQTSPEISNNIITPQKVSNDASSAKEIKDNQKIVDFNNIKISDIVKQIDGKLIVPQKYRKIYIMPIRYTYSNNYQDVISLSVFRKSFQDEIISNNYDFIIVNKKDTAELFLYIAVVDYKEIPLKYDEIRNVESYKAYIAINIKLDINPKIKEETLILNRLIEYQDTHNIRVFPYESVYSFKKRIYKTLSKRILLTLYTGWYTEDKNEDETNIRRNQDDDEGKLL